VNLGTFRHRLVDALALLNRTRFAVERDWYTGHTDGDGYRLDPPSEVILLRDVALKETG
jgi:hypothetical protein